MPHRSRRRIARIALFAMLMLCAVSYGAVSFSSSSTDAPTSPAANGALLTPPSCKGLSLQLVPHTAPLNFTSDVTTIERGEYITCIRQINVCSLGFKMQATSSPQTLNAYIYNANGTTRGSLLASGSASTSGTTNVFQYVPIAATLLPCKDYEVVFSITAGNSFESWSDAGTEEPFDVGDAIRVRDASANGNASSDELPNIGMFATLATTPPHTSDLAGPGAPPNVSTSASQERGVFVHMLDTAQLGSFGFEADLAAGTNVIARVYAATGTTRGIQLLAFGNYTVPSSGLQWHD